MCIVKRSPKQKLTQSVKTLLGDKYRETVTNLFKSLKLWGTRDKPLEDFATIKDKEEQEFFQSFRPHLP